MSCGRSPVVPDVIGWRVVQPFQDNIDSFLHLLLGVENVTLAPILQHLGFTPYHLLHLDSARCHWKLLLLLFKLFILFLYINSDSIIHLSHIYWHVSIPSTHIQYREKKWRLLVLPAMRWAKYRAYYKYCLL